MSPSDPVVSWLKQLNHDLVKRLLWVARDCRDLGRDPQPGELRANLVDDEGNPIEAWALWQHFAATAPRGLGLAEFELALRQCVAAAARNDLSGVLALERAYADLRDEAARLTPVREQR